MNKNILIVLAGGFLIAVLVAVIVQASLGGAKKEEVNIKKVEILVAAKALKTGHQIKSGDLKWQSWPEEAIFIGAILRDGEQQPTEVSSGKLLRPLVEGQPVHMTMIVEDDDGDFLSANLQKGMRAVGISVKSYVLADRLIRPGDFIDVMMTYQVRVNTQKNPEAQSLVSRYATETVIENIRVLAIDKEDTKAVDAVEGSGKKKKKMKSSKKATLTVEVKPEDAEKLVLANKMGDLGVALRSIGDNSTPESDGATTDVEMSRVMTKLSNMRETSSGVRIYSGTQMQEVQARNSKPESSINFNVEENQPAPTPTINIDPSALEGLINEE